MNTYTLGIDIGSTTVKIAILDENDQLLFADYERHFANIQETLADLLEKAHAKLGEMTLCPVITGSGGLTLANHLEIPFVQEVIAVSTSLQKIAPQTDVAQEVFPDLEFRYCSKCEGNYEYCADHLFTHQHVKKYM